MKAAQWITVWFLKHRVPTSNPIKNENSSTTETFGGFRNRSLHFFSPPNFHFFSRPDVRSDSGRDRENSGPEKNWTKQISVLKITQKHSSFFPTTFCREGEKTIARCFWTRRESNPRCRHSNQVRYPSLHCLSACSSSFVGGNELRVFLGIGRQCFSAKSSDFLLN